MAQAPKPTLVRCMPVQPSRAVGRKVFMVVLLGADRCGGCQADARMPRPALRDAMIAPPTATARNDRAKLVWKNLCRSQARVSSSAATTTIAALIAGP